VLQQPEVDTLDTGNDVGITQIECRKAQRVAQRGKRARHEVLATTKEGKIVTIHIYRNGNRVGLDTLGNKSCSRHSIIAASRAEDSALRDIASQHRQARNTAYAIATHLGVRAVGVEHIHSISATRGAHQKQKTVAAYATLPITRHTRKGLPIDTLVYGLRHAIDHYKVVARAVTFYYLEMCHFLLNIWSSCCYCDIFIYRPKLRNIFSPTKYLQHFNRFFAISVANVQNFYYNCEAFR
jgi:hypothetical protein